MDNTNMSSNWQVSGSSNLATTGNQTVDSSSHAPTHLPGNPFCPSMWDPPISGHNSVYCNSNAQDGSVMKGNMFLPSVSMMTASQSLPHFPPDSSFIDRAARFSCFGSGNLVEMMNPFAAPGDLSPYSRSLGFVQESLQLHTNEMDVSEASKSDKKNENVSGNESEEAEFSGHCAHEESSSKGFASTKRKRGTQGNERNEHKGATQTSIEMTKDNAEIKSKGNQKGTSGSKNAKDASQGSDLPKEDYIHVRARRGQATNSHSLAERVRREKISERMKFLQDLVPGCSKVTGKAVMLDEIINYVQSLQRQVEFLSMKLATVNPRLDFNIEGLLAKDILQHRGGMPMPPSLAFAPEMAMPFPSLHHQSPPGLILGNNSSENLRRPINLQSISISNGFKESTSQVPRVWEDELHNIVHMGFNSSAPLNSQDLIGSLPPGHMKPEP